MSDIEIIINELENRIQMSVLWDGYYDPENLLSSLEADTITNNTFKLSDVKKDILDRFYDGVEDYREVRQKTRDLVAIVRKEATLISALADKLSKTVKDIDSKYYDIAAKRFCEKYKEERILIAPDRWLPSKFR